MIFWKEKIMGKKEPVFEESSTYVAGRERASD